MAPQEQKAFFEDQGYLILEGLFTPDEMLECQEEVKRLHDVAATLKEANNPDGGHFQVEPYAGDESQADGRLVLRKIENTRRFSDVFLRLAQHPRLVEAVQNLIGPDLLLFRSTLMLKPAFHGSQHALHQDSAYWPMDPPTLVTVSIALNDSTSENGCIRVIPKSHEWGLQEWGRITRGDDEAATDRQDIDESQAVEAALTAGSAVCFHSLCVHGSGPNKSPKPRNTALYAYFSPEVRYVGRGTAARDRTFPVIAGLDGRSELTLTAAD
ncbi:phytanoyl-CoA dioxygenase family protein [Candidatus Poribacteria bacterium]|jgi:phytanoyl-CoA hydroxylase|nr:phytanoyl-CoA dioxygenase family protein [Candidatus Poribacteria bacterium]MBT5534184.1 phytanoyl-CoA dioxygenase family protein [Candidatus Poribacteria bacterium]MBT5710324.1 phytanoyl-CoA dioxygenase family protein [Candidatus Poribacteria bacterium]MBT7101185.1 phytanoyl-CoA dioxygenase family protein [Candidatus Poribacteria bacterium]MBT7808383.1 phytanoyl-CoA dioxygenase family protein [Candidatus Poribacteria bacterium]